VNLESFPIVAGKTRTLTYNEHHESKVTWPLKSGIWIYAQVDSYNSETTYGGILENHEMVGGTYNNITGVQFTGLHNQSFESNTPAKLPIPVDEDLLKQLPPRP
jgi:hypothetical protein